MGHNYNTISLLSYFHAQNRGKMIHCTSLEFRLDLISRALLDNLWFIEYIRLQMNWLQS